MNWVSQLHWSGSLSSVMTSAVQADFRSSTIFLVTSLVTDHLRGSSQLRFSMPLP